MTRTTILKFFKIAGLALVLAAIAWGARLTVVEGFVLEWPKRFQGDFAVVMYYKDYQANFWDGTGIVYGPIFVIESWLVARWPQLFTIYFFAFANVVLAAGAFVLCIKASRVSTPGIVLLGLAAWLCYWRLFYAFSVAANPEFLELFFLSFAWFVASRGREVTEGVLIAAAALTKLIPWIVIVPLILRRSVRALTAVAIFASATLLLVAYGQGMSPFEAVFQSIVPKNQAPYGLLVPWLRSTVQQGLLEAVARTLNWTADQPPVGSDLLIVRALFVTIVVVSLVLTVWSSIRLIRRRRQIGVETYLALTYAMYFALLPMLHLQAHPHTFLFLLPVWIAIPDRVWKDTGPIMTRAAFGAAVAFCYVTTGFPQALLILDRLFKTSLLYTWMGTEPMLGTVLLLCVIWSYIAVRTAAVRDQLRTSVAPV